MFPNKTLRDSHTLSKLVQLEKRCRGNLPAMSHYIIGLQVDFWAPAINVWSLEHSFLAPIEFACACIRRCARQVAPAGVHKVARVRRPFLRKQAGGNPGLRGLQEIGFLALCRAGAQRRHGVFLLAVRRVHDSGHAAEGTLRARPADCRATNPGPPHHCHAGGRGHVGARRALQNARLRR